MRNRGRETMNMLNYSLVPDPQATPTLQASLASHTLGLGGVARETIENVGVAWGQGYIYIPSINLLF